MYCSVFLSVRLYGNISDVPSIQARDTETTRGMFLATVKFCVTRIKSEKLANPLYYNVERCTDIEKYTKAFDYPPQAAISRMSCSTFDPRHLSSGVSPKSLTFNTSAP